MKLNYIKSVNVYETTKKKPFVPIGSMSEENKSIIFDFAWNMSFGKTGEHRKWRSGGLKVRSDMEIFCDAFIGKVGEFAVVNYFNKNGLSVPSPDISTHGIGIWDDYDLKIYNKKIAIKTTKHYGQLLLLETKDWNTEGGYIPNLSNKDYKSYDYFIAVRIRHEMMKIINQYNKKEKEKEEVTYKMLQSKINMEKFEYDLPGFMTNRTLKFLIKNNYQIEQGDILNTTIMDASNYYIQMNNLKHIDEITDLILKK